MLSGHDVLIILVGNSQDNLILQSHRTLGMGFE